MKTRFVSLVLKVNDDRPDDSAWIREAIENDLADGETVVEIREEDVTPS
jgi:hypothetical protein|tara:strand:+ start:628 stop:774 length:147 start_codon:yes stop_codon:yes gene_type:complete